MTVASMNHTKKIICRFLATRQYINNINKTTNQTLRLALTFVERKLLSLLKIEE
jgi:hypothetical protein